MLVPIWLRSVLLAMERQVLASIANWPNLAGQGQQYLFSQLKYFQGGEREKCIDDGRGSLS